MSQVNTFIVLSKDAERIDKAHKFMQHIESISEEDRHNEIRLDRLNTNKYGEWYALEGDLRNTYGSNIRYWMHKTDNITIFDNCYFIISYEKDDEIDLEDINSGTREHIVNAFDELYEKGKELSKIIPMDVIIQYFWDNL